MIFVRCKVILDELTQVEIDQKVWDFLHWSEISFNVASGFLRYLYSGIFDLQLNSFDEWNQAKSFGLSYGLNSWNSYVESLKDCVDQPNI